MAAVPAVLIPSQQIANANTAYYTSGTGVTTRIDSMSVANPTSSAVALTVFLVPSGGSPANSTMLISARGINVGQTYQCPEMIGKVLKPGDQIVALASSAASLTVSAAGTQFS